MAILDFSKAFDTVSHSKLLHKLDYYGIRSNTLNWIQSWITNRTQHVVLNGATSSQVDVKSGVPQGTVLGPLMFLVFINDIAESVQSKVRLFADDCLVYRNINNSSDASSFQQDLNRLCDWANACQMLFNENVCIVQPPYIHIKTRHTRSSLRSRLTSVSTSCNAYKYSFFPRTIQEWNT